MKQKFSYLLIAILVPTIFFIGCRKSDINPNNRIIPTTMNSSFSLKKEYNFYWENVEGQVTKNDLNPFDSVGYEHNVALYEIEAKCTPEMSYAEVMDITNNYLFTKYKKEIEGFKDPKKFFSETTNNVINALKEEKEYEYVDGLDLSEIEKEEMKKLLNIILGYNVDNYTEIINSIKNFEKTLLNNYDKNDIKIVLCASSVARYSLAYWHKKMNGNNKSWRKWFVGAADVIGGVAGGIGGAATGDAAGGVGAVVGAVAGAIVGAGNTSVAAGKLFDIWGHTIVIINSVV
jgi:hypothetical protein